MNPGIASSAGGGFGRARGTRAFGVDGTATGNVGLGAATTLGDSTPGGAVVGAAIAGAGAGGGVGVTPGVDVDGTDVLIAVNTSSPMRTAANASAGARLRRCGTGERAGNTDPAKELVVAVRGAMAIGPGVGTSARRSVSPSMELGAGTLRFESMASNSAALGRRDASLSRHASVRASRPLGKRTFGRKFAKGSGVWCK